ncbi:leukotriene C4 synthase isoform X1 [Crotalus tigris]|uniref:leukotriene C4 synthase isoform X1 n=1 Tax=Crotalus tigris TaxID=88082 RepID=UPI00192F1342|nr:leukotriene C4 synthase isoform X1 [Crotalus tigris]
MLHHIALLSTVTVLGVLEQESFLRTYIRTFQQLNNCQVFTHSLLQAYFAIQVIAFRRKFKVSPPITSGPPEFERIFRAQANCSEYFPIFLSLLWVAGIFSHQVLAAFCGLIYLYARYQYFRGYAHSAERRLGPMYFSAGVLFILIGLSMVGLLAHFVRYFNSLKVL